MVTLGDQLLTPVVKCYSAVQINVVDVVAEKYHVATIPLNATRKFRPTGLDLLELYSHFNLHFHSQVYSINFFSTLVVR